MQQAEEMDSTSLMHISMTKGRGVACSLQSVVRSTPKTLFTNFISGVQSFGTCVEEKSMKNLKSFK